MKKADLALRVLLSLACLGSGMADLTGAAAITESFKHLGVPVFYMPFFGVLKLCAVLGMFSPMVLKMEVLREGAQWGLVLYFLGAAVTHILGGDAANVTPGVVLTLLSAASLYLFEKTRAPVTAA